MILHRLALAVAALSFAPCAFAAPASAPAPPRYEQAPQPWRDFLVKARAADAIADPLQRCLAYPDVPGNQWPAQAAAQHCDWNFGPVPSLAQVRQLLDAKDVQGLEQRYAQLQALHQGHADFSERIHKAIDIFDSSYDAGSLSKRWLELAPDSPYALAARGTFYMHMGWAARGTKWMSETPKEQVEQMQAHFAKAVELLQAALKKEPRLMPAHAALVNIGANGELDEEAVFAAAVKADPGCTELMEERMRALEPRWGGSYEAMAALDHQLEPMLAMRPLLNLARADIFDDIHDVLTDADRHEEARAAVAPGLPLTTHPMVYEDMAESLSYKKDATEAERWQMLSYWVAASRFRPGKAWDARQRGRAFLLVANDAPAAAQSLEYAIAQEPGEAFGHYLYGATLGRLGRYDEAEREYLLAMKEPKESGTHRDSLIELAELMVHAGSRAKARDYGIRALLEYPTEPRALFVHALTFGAVSTPAKDLRLAWEDFLAKVDASDPRWAQQVAFAHKQLDDLKAAVLKSGGTW